jgi:general secretion pathway protein B
MSYILEALRRAEADRERERGQVPGLHAQPLPIGGLSSAAGGRRWLPWAGGGLLLLAGVGVGTWLAGGGSHDAAPPLPPPAPAPVVAALPPAEAVPAPVSAPPQPVPPAGGDPMRSPPVGAASPYLPPMPPPGTVTAPPARPAAPPTVTSEAPVPRVSELPDGVRRELPALSIGGSVYSDDPASRLVIVNGEVQHEGAKLTKDLVLEQIRPRELLLRFKGQRYRQPI